MSDTAPVNERAREVLLEALIAAGLVDDPTSEQWRNKTVEELSLILADAPSRLGGTPL
jgi:hypothetical protein